MRGWKLPDGHQARAGDRVEVRYRCRAPPTPPRGMSLDPPVYPLPGEKGGEGALLKCLPSPDREAASRFAREPDDRFSIPGALPRSRTVPLLPGGPLDPRSDGFDGPSVFAAFTPGPFVKFDAAPDRVAALILTTVPSAFATRLVMW